LAFAVEEYNIGLFAADVSQNIYLNSTTHNTSDKVEAGCRGGCLDAGIVAVI
jgi:hypothetical protein